MYYRDCDKCGKEIRLVSPEHISKRCDDYMLCDACEKLENLHKKRNLLMIQRDMINCRIRSTDKKIRELKKIKKEATQDE